MIDIKDYPSIVETINAILNNRGTAEIKNESHDGINLVVVQITRTVKHKE